MRVKTMKGSVKEKNIKAQKGQLYHWPGTLRRQVTLYNWPFFVLFFI